MQLPCLLLFFTFFIAYGILSLLLTYLLLSGLSLRISLSNIGVKVAYQPNLLGPIETWRTI